jgi:dTDP-4-amino-4,6-dideoxygalactose transaminase
MDRFDTALVLTRVLTSGVVMSIEKNDRELPGLERQLGKLGGRSAVVLTNSVTAAVHSALAGIGAGHGDVITAPPVPGDIGAFIAWLGVRTREEGEPAFSFVAVGPDDVATLADVLADLPRDRPVVLDLTGLGFGPAGAVLTDDSKVQARAERLKIFGTFDLRTMWTQVESEPELVPGVQFNYRLSPLVAACLRMSLSPRPARRPAGEPA